MTLKCTLSKPTLPWDRSKSLQMGMYPDLSFSAVEPTVTTITARSPPHYVSEAGHPVFCCPSSFSVLPQSRCQDRAGDGGLALTLETNKVFALWVDSS